jgi:RHS repeat-associated protein
MSRNGFGARIDCNAIIAILMLPSVAERRVETGGAAELGLDVRVSLDGIAVGALGALIEPLLTCGYTADGLRAWKTNSSGTTYFLFDGQALVCELNSTGSPTSTYTVGADGLVSRHIGTGSKFYLFDPQGTPEQRLSSTGSVLSSGMSDAFGATVGGSSTDPYSGYSAQVGYYTDVETGLQLLGHRIYDGVSGRFLTRDPYGVAGGINLYSYCHNSPGDFHDPTGFYWGSGFCEWTGGVGIIVCIVVSCGLCLIIAIIFFIFCVIYDACDTFSKLPVGVGD